jgi:hypothetical protein
MGAQSLSLNFCNLFMVMLRRVVVHRLPVVDVISEVNQSI